MTQTPQTRGPESLRILCEAAPEFGVTVEQCLERTGLNPFSLYDSDTLIKRDQELTVISNFLRHAPRRVGLGIEIGRRYRLEMFGIWGYAVLSSPTLGSGLETAVKFANLSFLIAHLELIQDRDSILLNYDTTGLPKEVKTFVLERHLAVLQTFSHALLVDPSLYQPVFRTTERDPQVLETLQRELGLIVQKDDKLDAVVLPRALLDLALPHHDSKALAICLEQCRDLLNRTAEAQNVWTSRVRDAVLSEVKPTLKIEDIAALLGVSPRTLNRRLRDEGTTFRKTLVKTRLAIAHEFLTTTGLSVSAAAWRVGYSEPSSFVRAYSREYGGPPRRVTRGSPRE